MNRKIEIIDGWTEVDIRRTLRGYAFSENALRYRIENLYVFNWESDFLCCTNSGFYYEYEIKISRSDFRADKKKKKKHLILEGKEEGKRPNYFYYAVPEGLLKTGDMPEYAGLVYLRSSWPYVQVVKPAPKLHPAKWSDDELGLTRKFYFNYRNWREQREVEIENLRKELNEAKSYEGKKHKYTLPQAIEKLEAEEKKYKEAKEELKKRWADNQELVAENRRLKRKLKENGIDYSDILEG